MRAKRARGINAALWHPDIWDARIFFRLKHGFAFFLLAQLFCFFLQTCLLCSTFFLLALFLLCGLLRGDLLAVCLGNSL